MDYIRSLKTLALSKDRVLFFCSLTNDSYYGIIVLRREGRTLREKDEEFEKFFNKEIREKKFKTYGNRAKTSANGVRKSGRKALFISDTMTKKELKEYTKAGKVETYNMYETIIPKHEFNLKPKDIQKSMMARWREIHTNTKIMSEMGLSNSNALSRILKDLDIPQKQRGGNRKGKRDNPESTPMQTPSLPTVQAVQQIITNGLHLEYNGNFDSEQLIKIFTKLQLVTEDEQNKFRLSLSLTEITKDN